jgi:hypothetical protein
VARRYVRFVQVARVVLLPIIMTSSDAPDGYLAMSHDLRVLEASPWAWRRLLGDWVEPAVSKGTRQPSHGREFRACCQRVLAAQKPSAFEIEWSDGRRLCFHAWPSRRALFLCVRELP